MKVPITPHHLENRYYAPPPIAITGNHLTPSTYLPYNYNPYTLHCMSALSLHTCSMSMLLLKYMWSTHLGVLGDWQALGQNWSVNSFPAYKQYLVSRHNPAMHGGEKVPVVDTVATVTVDSNESRSD